MQISGKRLFPTVATASTNALMWEYVSLSKERHNDWRILSEKVGFRKWLKR
jgi:hypothetical protein